MSNSSRAVRHGRIAVWLAALFVAAANGAVAQGIQLPTPALVAGRMDAPSLLQDAAHIGASRSGLVTDAFSLKDSDLSKPLTLPLTLSFGGSGGVSFLYARPAALTLADGQKPVWNPQGAAYGLSNSLALGRFHLDGVFSLSGGKLLSALSQTLTYAAGGWNMQAHFKSLDAKADGLSALRGATSALGAMSGMTSAALGELDALRGKRDLGFAAGYAARGSHFGFTFQNLADAGGKADTRRQLLSLGRSFGHGLSFEASRETVDLRPQNGQGALTTTTDHLSLSLAPMKGAAFSFAYQSIADTTGKADTHQTLSFSKSFGAAAQFAATHDTTALRPSGGGNTLTTSTDHLSLNLAPVKGASLATDAVLIHDSQGHSEQHLTSHLGYAAHALSLTADLKANHNADGHSDRTLACELTRQAGSLSLKADWQQFTPASCGSPIQTTQGLQMTWKAGRVLTLDGGWADKLNPGGARGADRNCQAHLAWMLRRDLNFDLKWNHDNHSCADNPQADTRATQLSWQLGGPLTRALRWSARCEQSDRTGCDGTQNILFGLQGTVGAKQNLELSVGRRQQLAGSDAVSGPTVQLAYNCKADDADYLTLNAELTDWDAETPQTPSALDASVRLDWKKQF
ncbi:MAG: hypothetical protein JO250_08895 [Armatimonadetes bacterium]|nr:hypothetical protein [Armatimonadota bacterium]